MIYYFLINNALQLYIIEFKTFIIKIFVYDTMSQPEKIK